MAKQANHGPKFFLTRVMLIGSVGALVAGTWSAIAISEARTAEADAASSEPAVEQDGWRWDPTLNDWVPVATATSAATAEPVAAASVEPPVIIVERQPVIRYVYYIQETPVPNQPPAAAATPASVPAARTVTASGGAPASSATPAPGSLASPGAPAADAGLPPVDTGVADTAAPVLPPPPPVPASLPAAPAPAAPAPAPAPPAPTAPPAPKPKAPASKGS